MLPIPMISKVSITPKSNSKYWLDSSNDDYLFNKSDNGQSLIFSTNGTSEQPTYGNVTLNSITRRTFRLRVLTSNSVGANIEVFDQSPNFQTGQGFTVIRIKNSVALSLSPKVSPVFGGRPEFVLQTGFTGSANTVGDIKNIFIEPHGDNSGTELGIQIGWISETTQGNYIVNSSRFTVGTCILRSSESRVFIDVIKVTPNFIKGQIEFYSPNVEWTRETKTVAGNYITCNGLLTSSQGFYGVPSPTDTTNIFRPTRVRRNADNSVSTNAHELECLVFNEVLNQQSIDNITTYLKNKWSF